MKKIKSLSWFLGTSMFMFGILKFVNPFKGWYTTQVTNSGLGEISYAMGIAGEIAVGLLLLFCMIYFSKLPVKLVGFAITFASVVIIVMMATGVYVHMHPAVPADVLPLKIKPPFIPFMFMLLSLANIYYVRKNHFLSF